MGDKYAEFGLLKDFESAPLLILVVDVM